MVEPDETLWRNTARFPRTPIKKGPPLRYVARRRDARALRAGTVVPGKACRERGRPPEVTTGANGETSRLPREGSRPFRRGDLRRELPTPGAGIYLPHGGLRPRCPGIPSSFPSVLRRSLATPDTHAVMQGSREGSRGGALSRGRGAPEARKLAIRRPSLGFYRKLAATVVAG